MRCKRVRHIEGIILFDEMRASGREGGKSGKGGYLHQRDRRISDIRSVASGYEKKKLHEAIPGEGILHRGHPASHEKRDYSGVNASHFKKGRRGKGQSRSGKRLAILAIGGEGRGETFSRLKRDARKPGP